jgi:putative transposase
MKRKAYSSKDIAAKLEQGDKLATEGKSQNEIVKTLGISVMTYHRWRKARQTQETAVAYLIPKPNPAAELAATDLARIKDLELENARLRQLVTDALLDKLKLQEMLDARPKSLGRAYR